RGAGGCRGAGRAERLPALGGRPRDGAAHRGAARALPVRVLRRRAGEPDLGTVAASGTAWRCARSTTARPATPSRRPAPTAPRAAPGAPAAGGTCRTPTPSPP